MHAALTCGWLSWLVGSSRKRSLQMKHMLNQPASIIGMQIRAPQLFCPSNQRTLALRFSCSSCLPHENSTAFRANMRMLFTRPSTNSGYWCG